MVKVIAGILLFFGCTALGFSKASGYKGGDDLFQGI